MIFSSYSFLFAFLPLTLLIYFGMSRFVSRQVQQVFLILASLYFYSYAADLVYAKFLIQLILGSTILNFTVATLMQNRENVSRKLLFIVGILFNVGLLGYYKYHDFFFSNINQLFGADYSLLRIAIPLGISFFTFQQIAFLISVWQKQERVPPFIDYVLFITFFPQIISGPIVFSQDVMTQYQDDKKRFFDANNFSQGLYLFLIGLFKKAVIGDSLDVFVNNGFYFQYADLSFGGAWIVALSFTLRIFFDFSGYSDMALGLAKMFNFNFPVNFYSPYKANSITEFWKRWHITLGRSLAILVYYPLGGNRKGLARTCLNLFIVFLVSGIWHGANWTFVIWGAAHGVVRVFEKLAEKPLEKIPNFIRIFFTFIFVNAAWVMFNSRNISSGFNILKRMFFPDRFSFEGISDLANDGLLSYTDSIRLLYVLFLIFGLLGILFFYRKNSINLYQEFTPTKKKAIFVAALFSISVVHLSRVAAFIYYNF